MRETKAFGEPYEAVDFRKQEKIRRTMEYFLLANPKYKNFNIQFDVISILGESLEHIKEAF